MFRNEAHTNRVLALTWGASPYEGDIKWNNLLRHMLDRQKLVGRDLQDDNLICFDQLLVGRSQRLDWCACPTAGLQS